MAAVSHEPVATAVGVASWLAHALVAGPADVDAAEPVLAAAVVVALVAARVLHLLVAAVPVPWVGLHVVLALATVAIVLYVVRLLVLGVVVDVVVVLLHLGWPVSPVRARIVPSV